LRASRRLSSSPPSRRLSLEVRGSRTAQDAAALAAFEKAGTQGLIVAAGAPSALTEGDPKRLAALIAQHRLPATYNAGEFIAAGGLISYGVNYPDLFRRAALYVDKILKGARLADLPVEEPTVFELRVNLKTAKTLGLAIAPSLLVGASEVIE
jgi:putative tryptophan/tyrosine transport system substrate-binding protein